VQQSLPCSIVNAGGAALHGVVQHLLQAFEAHVPPHSAYREPSRNPTVLSRHAPPSVGWQRRAAAAVVTLTEVLYGASSAWQSPQARPLHDFPSHIKGSNRPNSNSDSAGQGMAAENQSDSVRQKDDRDVAGSQHQADVHEAAGSACGMLEGLVVQVLNDFSRAGVWQLPTHLDIDAAVDASTPLTPQVYSVAGVEYNQD